VNCPTDGTRLEMSERNEQATRPRDDDRPRGEHQQQRKKKRTSFLSERFEGG